MDLTNNENEKILKEHDDTMPDTNILLNQLKTEKQIYEQQRKKIYREEKETFLHKEKRKLADKERVRKRRNNENIDETIKRRKIVKEQARKRCANETVEESQRRRHRNNECLKKSRLHTQKSKKRYSKEETRLINNQWPLITPHEVKLKL